MLNVIFHEKKKNSLKIKFCCQCINGFLNRSFFHFAFPSLCLVQRLSCSPEHIRPVAPVIHPAIKLTRYVTKCISYGLRKASGLPLSGGLCSGCQVLYLVRLGLLQVFGENDLRLRF